MWIKMWKSYSEGPGSPKYYEYSDEKDIEHLIKYLQEEEYWDEGNYHKILWEQIEKPPKKWIEEEIKECAEIYKNLYKNYRKSKISIEESLKMLKLLIKDT